MIQNEKKCMRKSRERGSICGCLRRKLMKNKGVCVPIEKVKYKTVALNDAVY